GGAPLVGALEWTGHKACPYKTCLLADRPRCAIAAYGKPRRRGPSRIPPGDRSNRWQQGPQTGISTFLTGVSMDRALKGGSADHIYGLDASPCIAPAYTAFRTATSSVGEPIQAMPRRRPACRPPTSCVRNNRSISSLLRYSIRASR